MGNKAKGIFFSRHRGIRVLKKICLRIMIKEEKQRSEKKASVKAREAEDGRKRN